MVRRYIKQRSNRRRTANRFGSVAVMPYQQYVRGNASLSAGQNFVTYSIANLASDLVGGRAVFPLHITVKFQPIFPTGTVPGTNIIFAQLQFRDPSTLTDVPASTVKLLSQTSQTRLKCVIPALSSGWFASSNTSVIMSIYITTSIACNLLYDIDSHFKLARDANA